VGEWEGEGEGELIYPVLRRVRCGKVDAVLQWPVHLLDLSHT
jgi:hypothetical protein